MSLKDVPDLIRSIATLGWVILAGVALKTFAPEIKRILGRLKVAKLLGGELQTYSLHEEVEVVRGALPEINDPKAGPPSVSEESAKARILREAAQSPKLGLITLQREIERETRQLLMTLGTERRVTTFRDAIAALSNQIPPSVVASVEAFSQVRNRIVHGRDASDDEALSAIDSGLSILEAFRSIPRAPKIVSHPGVALFADPAGNQLVPGAKAVLIDVREPNGPTRQMVFPTTKSYEKGQSVSWEWNPAKVFGPGWYRKPGSEEVVQGWEGSMEFVGRPLDEI